MPQERAKKINTARPSLVATHRFAIHSMKVTARIRTTGKQGVD